MIKHVFLMRLNSSTMFIAAAMLSPIAASQPAYAQANTNPPAAEDADKAAADIIVTGSRIRRSAEDSVAPLEVVSQDYLLERGYTQVGEALNALPSNIPFRPSANGSGTAPGSGQQFPNLFGLGAGRTLSLVNGRRMVTTASGLGDRVVDTNIIPKALLKRIDVVQAGGAAVYGTDAIAGVVNYVLRDDFEGVRLDAQGGISSRGDYPRHTFSGLFGLNFAEGRGNIAVDLEYNKTASLLFGSRPITNPVIRAGSTNPLDTGPNDGIPSRSVIVDPRFWVSNQYGVIFRTAGASLANILGQFNDNGSGVIPYNPGVGNVPGFSCTTPFCSGGDGYPYGRLSSLRSAVETYSGIALAHYDLTDSLRISGDFLYAHSLTRDPLGIQTPNNYVIGNANTGAIPFNRNNPFLSAAAIASLSALSPTFATGSNLFLSKNYEDLLPTREVLYKAKTYRGGVNLDGDFSWGDRNFNYTASYYRGVVKGSRSGWDVATAPLFNALSATRNSSGQIVCSINATTVADATCAPINPFGLGNISQQARLYVSRPSGSNYKNTQDDFLATLSGDLFKGPAGAVKFSLAYEHRAEKAEFVPFQANQLGVFRGNVSAPTGGRFNTDEFSGELIVPVIKPEWSIPLVEELEVSGQYRSVDNSIAGKEDVWGAGARWKVGYGFTARVSRSRNFRAPSLDQIFAPRATTLARVDGIPCDSRFISTGVAPATRRANCQALFAANPSFGNLATFTDPSVNFANALVTTGGNPNLKNEISDTTTFGFVWQPEFVPGRLTLAYDRIRVNLKDGLTAFTASDFVRACFDASPQPQAACSTFTLNPTTGFIQTAMSTTFNAAFVKYRGEIYKASYWFPLEMVTGADLGNLLLSFDATHNRRLSTSVSGVITETAGTINLPKWLLRANAVYNKGPFTLSYEMNYLDKAKLNLFDTIETTPFVTVASNMRHNVSTSYDFGKLKLRAGINNFTDRGPSFSTVLTYGDVVGREFFVGAQVDF